MSLMLKDLLKIKSDYRENRHSKSLSKDDYEKKLSESTTVYIGNLSFFTSQWSIHELFSRCGRIKRIIMGHNTKGEFCGFCFVEYHTHEEAAYAVEYVSRTKLDGRIIRVDWDMGYTKGRELGRGAQGYQKRDIFAASEDPERFVSRNSFKRPRYNQSKEKGQSKEYKPEPKSIEEY